MRLSGEKLTDKEERLLRTAMQVFIEKGKHGARMQEIADRAGINKALLHYYFRSKEKLYARIMEYVLKKNILDMMNILKEQGTFEEYLRTFIDRYIDLLKENPQLPLFIMRELNEGGEVIKEILRNLQGSLSRMPADYLQVLRRAMDKGEVVKMDPLQIVSTIVGACVYFFIAEPMFTAMMQLNENFDRERFIEERKEAVFKIIAYGIIPRGEQ